jgi:hypothetical protein
VIASRQHQQSTEDGRSPQAVPALSNPAEHTAPLAGLGDLICNDAQFLKAMMQTRIIKI